MMTCRDCGVPMFPVEDSSCPFCKNVCDENKEDTLLYCDNCKVLFDQGCNHSDNVHNAAIMSGFTADGREYKGMLVFDSRDKALEFQNDVNSNKVQVKFECSCNGSSYTCIKSTIEKKSCNYK